MQQLQPLPGENQKLETGVGAQSNKASLLAIKSGPNKKLDMSGCDDLHIFRAAMSCSKDLAMVHNDKKISQ